MNDARLRVTGMSREAQIGRKLFDVFPDDPDDPTADGVRNLTASLERVIASADGIDYIDSQSAQGLSIITVHLKLNYDTNAALTQIQAKVAQVRNDLPPEAEAPETFRTVCSRGS